MRERERAREKERERGRERFNVLNILPGCFIIIRIRLSLFFSISVNFYNQNKKKPRQN